MEWPAHLPAWFGYSSFVLACQNGFRKKTVHTVAARMRIARKHPFAQWKAALKRIPGLTWLVRWGRIGFDPVRRSQWRLQRQKSDALFQPYGNTRHNRYPRIFRFICEDLLQNEAPRILSYGCSTGDEVFSLKGLMPRAEITGIDINPYNIAECRRKWKQVQLPGVRFLLADSPDAEPDSYYDAILCMAVLRHGDLGAGKPARCDHLIRFEDFEGMVARFCRILKPGGCLAIRYSNFRFADTAVAAKFDVVFSVKGKEWIEKTPLYGRDNRLLPDTVYNDVVFRKRETA